MLKEKLYTGTVANVTTTKAIHQYYGAPGTVNASKYRMEALYDVITDFLTECGVDARHDDDYIWIDGLPLVFYAQASTSINYCSVFSPFASAAFITGANNVYCNIFSGTNYNIRLRLAGEPQSTFWLCMSGTNTFSDTMMLLYCKAQNILNGRESRVLKNGLTVAYNAYDLEDDGTLVDIGRSVKNGAIYDFTLQTQAVDYTNNPDKIPLVEALVSIFKLPGCYMYPANMGAASVPVYSAAPLFIKIGGEACCTPGYSTNGNITTAYGPLIKCT